jgi:hypothetical protein
MSREIGTLYADDLHSSQPKDQEMITSICSGIPQTPKLRLCKGFPLVGTIAVRRWPAAWPTQSKLPSWLPSLHVYPALVKDVDDVGVLDCAQAMRDGDGCTALCGGVEGGLYDAFGCGVEGGCGFVEKQDLRVAEEGAGNGYALTLKGMLAKSRAESKRTYLATR